MGLVVESQSELMTRAPVQTFDLIVINDVCTSVLEPVPILDLYTFYVNDPNTSELVIELDAESGDCSYLIVSIGTTPPVA